MEPWWYVGAWPWEFSRYPADHFFVWGFQCPLFTLFRERNKRPAPDAYDARLTDSNLLELPEGTSTHKSCRSRAAAGTRDV